MLCLHRRCVQWFSDQNRRNAIVIVDGHVLPKLKLGEQLPPIPPDELLAEVAKRFPGIGDMPVRKFLNSFVTSLEDKNFFNKQLTRKPLMTDRLFRRSVVVAVISLICISFIYALARLPWTWKPYRSIKQERYRRQLKTAAAYRGGLHVLARNFFLTPETSIAWCQSTPKLESTQSWYSKLRTRRDLKYLWRWATRDQRMPANKRQLRRLNNTVSKLKRLRESGNIRIIWDKA